MRQNTVVRVAQKGDLATVRILAGRIWPATYVLILSPAQIEYMLEQMYSMESLQQQMDDYHHIFLILEYDSEPVGFASYSINAGESKGKLQKIYIDPDLQGNGLGKFLLESVVECVKKAGCQTLILDVNRNNKARHFYERQGFSISQKKDTDIGNGFFMNDYVMERSLMPDSVI